MKKIRLKRIQVCLNVNAEMCEVDKLKLKAQIKEHLREIVESKNIEVYTTYQEEPDEKEM